jgi:VanZ like family
MASAISPGWLTAAIAASVAVILAAPVVGQATALLRDVAKGNYVTVLVVIVAAAASAAVVFALFTIRHHRWQRYTWIAAAIALAVSYAWLARTGILDADAAERFHFIEYGCIAVLFYKAWRPGSDGAVIVMPLVAGILVGTLEEWLQWFVPGRVGESKDVLLNLVAVSAGTLFALGLDPPPRISLALNRQSRRHAAVLLAATIVVFAGFFQSVHLGHEIADREAGVFRSRYDADELRAVSRSRADLWKVSPPLTWARFSQEDQYLTEGVAHVRRRNQRWEEGNLLAARHENLILENYYAPVLDTPTYISATGHRWPDAQRAQAEGISGPGFMIYESDALDYPVLTWPPALYWLVVTVAILLGFRRML